MKTYVYQLEMKVRDYECDLQQVVNNANYQHYLEHARHEFLESSGASFRDLHLQGIDPVVSRIEITYKTPLRSMDTFVVGINVGREGVRGVFFQDIYRKSDRRLCVSARVEIAIVRQGALDRGELFDELFGRFYLADSSF